MFHFDVRQYTDVDTDVDGRVPGGGRERERERERKLTLTQKNLKNFSHSEQYTVFSVKISKHAF
jgi:hypothetical protein